MCENRLHHSKTHFFVLLINSPFSLIQNLSYVIHMPSKDTIKYIKKTLHPIFFALNLFIYCDSFTLVDLSNTRLKSKMSYSFKQIIKIDN